MEAKYLTIIPKWANDIWEENYPKSSVAKLICGWEGDLMWGFDWDTIQCMRSQIVGEILDKGR